MATKGRASELDKVIAELEAEREAITKTLNRLITARAAAATRKKHGKPIVGIARTRRGEGASTDSANMNYPPG